MTNNDDQKQNISKLAKSRDRPPRALIFLLVYSWSPACLKISDGFSYNIFAVPLNREASTTLRPDFTGSTNFLDLDEGDWRLPITWYPT
jgi:hypothetical protein